MTYNRQGFMITTDNFMGQPNDKTLYGPTLERFRERMQAYPDTAVTALGFRRAQNRKRHTEEIAQVFMGRSTDVEEAHQEACGKARSATEGFIAVANHLRGFGRSLYRGLSGATRWTRLSPCAYNVKKFLQLYRAEALEESTLLMLRLSMRSPAAPTALSTSASKKPQRLARCPPLVRPQLVETGPD